MLSELNIILMHVFLDRKIFKKEGNKGRRGSQQYNRNYDKWSFTESTVITLISGLKITEFSSSLKGFLILSPQDSVK